MYKRPRSLHYGIHKQQLIVQNGVAQLSPLDRKSLPLDQQKQLSLTLSSDDREGAASNTSIVDPSPTTDCVINFVDAVKGVYAYQILSFSFTNYFYSIEAGLNDVLVVGWLNKPTAANQTVQSGLIRIPSGYYTFFTEPKDWANQNDPASTDRNLNDIKWADRVELTSYYPNDIRVALLIAADSAISEIKTNRILKTIEITWVAVVAGPTSPTASPTSTTLFDTYGLSRFSSGSTWTGIAPVKWQGPDSLALISDVLNNSEVIDPDGPSSFFLHVPVTVPQGQRQLYIPPNPPLVTFNSQVSITRVPIKIADHKTQRVLTGDGVEWQLILSAFTTDVTPAK